MGQNKDDISLFNKLQLYMTENEDSFILYFIIGGDFNTVLNPEIDKLNGRQDTHKKCNLKINNIIDTIELADIWRIQHPDTRTYSWHSSHKPPIFLQIRLFSDLK